MWAGTRQTVLDLETAVGKEKAGMCHGSRSTIWNALTLTLKLRIIVSEMWQINFGIPEKQGKEPLAREAMKSA